MSDKASENSGRVPKWALLILRRFVVQSSNLHDFVLLSMRGLSLVEGMPDLHRILASIDADGDVGVVPSAEETQRQQDDAKRAADLAGHESSSGFPLLHGQAVVTLWSLLESFVRVLVASWLEHRPEAFSRSAVAALKVRVGDYQPLSRRERCEYLAELLERDKAAGLRAGVGRFESVLECLGLEGEVPDRLRRDVLELAQVRNAIAHRGGLVDTQLVEACPWLGVAAGDELRVSHAMFRRYNDAGFAYCILVFMRVGMHFNDRLEFFRANYDRLYGVAAQQGHAADRPQAAGG